MAETIPETARTTTLRLDVPIWPGHRAGQHVDVRLTAEDGYQAQRSYSIGSPPRKDRLELTVVRIDDGEVSPYLTTVAEVGDQFEFARPDRRVVRVGRRRHHAGAAGRRWFRRGAAHGDHAPPRPHGQYRGDAARLLGAHTRGRHLPRPVDHVGRQWSPGRRPHAHPRNVTKVDRVSGRVDTDLFGEVGWPPQVRPRCYVCGPTPFVEAVSVALVGLGHEAAQVKTERFGPTGG